MAFHVGHGTGIWRMPDASTLLQVYAVALYVEAEPAANELGIRRRGGFFTDDK